MATVLVTGGAGYVGSHACKALAAAGHQPITYDNLSRGHHGAVKWGPLEIGDLTDKARLDEVFEKYKPDAVMHFAALAYVGESVTQPLAYYRNNVAGTLLLLSAAQLAECNRFVFSSSCAVYGNPPHVPIDEAMPTEPISPYGRSKLMVENILRDCGKNYDLNWIALRYFNAAGADPDGEIGEDHDPEPHLIPNVLSSARNGTPLTINGESYDTPDGTCVRDYIHVSDIAQAHVLALDALHRTAVNKPLNLGTGTGYSIREVLIEAENVTQTKISQTVGPPRPGDPAILVADGSAAQKQFGWVPERSNLSDMIADAWAWARSGDQN